MNTRDQYYTMVEDVEVKHAFEYTFRYRKIFCELRKWHNGVNEVWNYYIYVMEDTLDEEGYKILFMDEATHFKNGIWKYRNIDNYISFHNGISYYRRIHDYHEENNAVKLGCDYDHIYDYENGVHTLEEIVQDCKNTVDSLLDNTKFNVTIKGETF